MFADKREARSESWMMGKIFGIDAIADAIVVLG